MNKLVVIALGGNALLRDNQVGLIEEQEANTAETLENFVPLLKQGYNLVISHGNGPQVGNIVMRNDAGEQLYGVAQMPLDVCVADTQGGIGYMLERNLRNILARHNIERDVITLMTMVEVDGNDPAFKNPTKRIGKMLTKEEADQLSATKGWTFKPEQKQQNGYRRVVASPMPINIANWPIIEKNARQGTIVIAVGGGGVPVVRDQHNCFTAAEAVIDKDLATSLLASEIKADEFYILTDVPFVYLNYGQPNQEKLEHLSYDRASELLQKGAFGEGNMAPKVKAVLNYLKNGGKTSIITESNKLLNTSFGTTISNE